MEANEPNTTNQTSYVLLNNELEKIQGRIDSIEEKIDLLANGMNILILNVKNTNEVLTKKKPSLVDVLPDDEDLDDFEYNEGTCKDYSRVTDEPLTEKELEPFVKKEPSIAQQMYDACPTEEELDALDKKEMDDYVKNV